MGDLRAVEGTGKPGGDDNVKRADAWKRRTGGTIETDDYGWHVARNGVGRLLGRRMDLGQLLDFLERPGDRQQHH